MTQAVILKPQSFLDPTGSPKRRPAKLARRLESLRGKQILLFDNGQLRVEYPLCGGIFETLSNILTEDFGVSACPHMVDEFLVASSRARLKEVAADVLKRGVDGVVVALANAGVTQPSVILAAQLERAGLPVVMICSRLGGPLAAVSAQSYVPGLPLITIDSAIDDSEAMVSAKARGIVGSIVEGLTSSEAELRKRFQTEVGSADGPLKTDRGGKLRLTSRMTLTTSARSKTIKATVDPSRFAAEIYEEFCDRHMCDGFPIIVPTQERVARMLRFTDREPQEALLDECPPSGAPVTIEKLAVNAVMAGCKPEYFPIVVTAFEAMSDPSYRLFLASITTNPAGNAVVVSGPLGKELGIQSGAGCLGPGFRANATIGRTLTLCMINICRAIPAGSDLATFGSPAEYSYCFAESDEDNPWVPFHTELYDAETTTVTVHKVEGPQDAVNQTGATPEDLLAAIASQAATLGANNYSWPCELIVILSPAHARILARAGWSKEDVKLYLFDKARNPAKPRREAKGIPPAWPSWFWGLDSVPVVHAPNEILIFVAGGRGRHDMVARPWGLARAITKPVTFKDGTAVKSIHDFEIHGDVGERGSVVTKG